MRRSLFLLALWASGCVYPATEPTGMELSWRFLETNLADGEDAKVVWRAVVETFNVPDRLR